MEKKLKIGLIHIYTGDGKGKTTAALGQGVRSAGAGLRVLMLQFLKGEDTGELHSLEQIESFEVRRFEKSRKFYFQMNDEEKEQVKAGVLQGLAQVRQSFREESHDLIIIDEIMGVLSNGIVPLEAVLELVAEKPAQVELVLTGRNAPEALVAQAHYVTEMKLIKHPYQQGIYARKGIES